ncbi:MAG: Gfo/Idh/MocA family oxidoreductase, partial [Prevotellaceae bacterium]|nr:Gfo/Idh/MocA family oxidoreductase [Prevotellaceae bacterium]
MNNRREFLKKSAVLVAGSFLTPTIVPASVFGKKAPSNRITVAAIGCGRQMLNPNLPQMMKSPHAQVVALCDVDKWRLDNALKSVNDFYGNEKGVTYKGCKTYSDYRKLLQDKSIDAVMIASPDHWHIPMAIDAIRAGKHVSLEKSISTCIAHGRKMVEEIKKHKVITRNDSEFRTLPKIWRAVEVVRNGRIGKLRKIEAGVPPELNGSAVPPQPNMPVPAELDYDFWLGPAFEAPYTENRVHGIKKYGRPGWLRVSDYCNGVIASWGAHLMGIAQWGNDAEYTGPIEIEGVGEFDHGLWNTLNTFDVKYKFANGVEMVFTIGRPYVRFEGESGWVNIEYPDKLTASANEIIDTPLGTDEKSFKVEWSDKDDFFLAIKENRQSLEPLETAHRTVSVCQLGLIAIKIGNRLQWDPVKEDFIGDNA